jgi:23S rRNA-intervening sequence protein
MSESRSQCTKTDKPQFDICERTFQFALRIVHVCELLDQSPGVCWTLSKQLLKAGTSVGANLEEAQGGQSRADSSRNTQLLAKRPVKRSIGCAF